MTVTEFPELPAVMLADGTGWRAWCVHCKGWHMHGLEPGHVVSHCFRRESPLYLKSYVGVLADPGTGPAAEARVKAAAQAAFKASPPARRAEEPVLTVPAWVYRPFDAEGGLLYIGVSKDFGERWKKHAQTQPWWPEVRHMTTTWYPDEASAYAAETAAILAEKPRWNIAKTKPARSTR
jgi:hypothetical protein